MRATHGTDRTGGAHHSGRTFTRDVTTANAARTVRERHLTARPERGDARHPPFTKSWSLVHVIVGCRLPGRPNVNHVRDLYHDDLDGITTSLVDITRLAGEAIERATVALLEADLAAAE